MYQWNYLGHGTYNIAYIDRAKKVVFKVQRDLLDKTDAPERSVRLWNLLNSDLRPKASIYTDSELGKGWICPFIEGKPATDEEIHTELIAIYNKHGRIVLDSVGLLNEMLMAKLFVSMLVWHYSLNAAQ